jgi:hypothetical protein
LHLKNNESKNFISINCLKYVMIIINYCAAITTLLESQITTDPHPVVLCVTDNTSTKNWTMHTSKKSIIGCALARFFCGLLIGSDAGIMQNGLARLLIRLRTRSQGSRNLLTILPHSNMTSPNFNKTMRN